MRQSKADFLDILTQEQLLATIPSGLFLVDLDQRIVYWNNEAERITGYSAQEALGQHCSFLEGIECGQGCGLYDPEVKKPIIGAVCRVRTKAGETIFLSKNVDYLFHDGDLVGGIESFIDLTPQKKLESALRDHAEQLEETVRRRTAELELERSQLRNLLEAMDDLAYIATPDYRITFVNRAVNELLGPVVGKVCYEALYQRSDICTECPMAEILKGQTVRGERFNPLTGKTYDILHTRVQTTRGHYNKLSVCRDITERKRIENELRSTVQELDSFVHTVSHDLRTPLTPIIGFSEFLLQEYGDRLEPQVREILHDIEAQGQRMVHLIEDLLELARVGRLQAPTEEVQVPQLMQVVVEELRQRIEELGAEVRIEALPDAWIHPTLLQQLFTNLLSNALKYGTPPGGRVDVGGQREGRVVRYFVRDFGAGVPVEDRERIFDLFYRCESAQAKTGTGVGLATVRKIARLYQGQVWVEETPGGGSTFWVELHEMDDVQPAP